MKIKVVINVILAQNGVPVRRRIIPVCESDSDSDCILVIENTGGENGKTVKAVKTVKTSDSNSTQSDSKDKMKNLSLSVSDKENQMKYLISSFPKVDTMVGPKKALIYGK